MLLLSHCLLLLLWFVALSVVQSKAVVMLLLSHCLLLLQWFVG